jgi:hypothetical protein
MKKIGITADNYKVETFKKNLDAQGFKNLEIVPCILAGRPITLIRVLVEDKDYAAAMPKITNICKVMMRSSN